MNYVSVRAVASQLKSQFKVDMDLFEVIQACGTTLKNLGLFALERSLYAAYVSNFCVTLPDCVWKVRGVFRMDGVAEPPFTIIAQDIYFPPYELFVRDESPDDTSEPILYKENYIPILKGFRPIDHVWEESKIKFNETDIPVAVETTGIKKDKEGFPSIPESAFEACVYYSLFVYHQPLYLLKQIDGSMMGQLEAWKDRKMAQANQSSRMEALNSNEKDKLMDIMVSMDRKAYGIPS